MTRRADHLLKPSTTTRMTVKRLLSVLAIALLLTPATARAQDEVVYYHTDAIGSVRMITDATDTVIGRYDYIPFGVLWPAEPAGPTDGRQFAGKERDADTGLDYFGARYYRSQSGRFTSVDPILNIEEALTDPQRWNRYSYGRNNPFVFIDPDGRDITTPSTFQQQAFTQQVSGNLQALAKVAVNIARSMNSPGHMTPQAEAVYFEQPDSPAEAKRMQFFDLALTAIPAIGQAFARSGAGGRLTLTRTVDLEPTHGQTLSNRAFSRLKADIAEHGIQEPIKYVQYNGQKYVVDGHHRLEAAKALGMRTVPTQEVNLPYAGYKTAADLNYVYR